MKVAVKHVYTSVACNRKPEILDWNRQGLICFGATNAVVIYNNKLKGTDPLTVLSHHRSLVKSVKWVHKPDGSAELLSCSADKTAAVWSLVDGVWRVTSTLVGHSDGVTCIHGVYYDDSLMVYTGSIDSTVRVWERKDGVMELKHTIQLNHGLCLTLHSYILQLANKPILLCALDDFKIHIFTGDEYERVHTLLGHEDWVRGLDVLDVDDNTVLLASASQDTHIRVWNIHHETEQSDHINTERQVFLCGGRPYTVKLDAVLSGHEGWVYGVRWLPSNRGEGKKPPIYRLLSSSLDKTLIIWEPEDAGGAWSERVRLGGAGGGGLGYYGGVLGPGGEVAAHGYNGTLHVWRYDEDSSEWRPSVAVGGHFGPVEDVRWEPRRGRHIVSVAADQTTRLHAPWNTKDGLVKWCEIARPQVHGYDMSSLALLSSSTLASAAEEKVIRVFGAPDNFHHNYRNITRLVLDDAHTAGPEGASVPSLGLSNKAVFTGDDQSDRDNDGYFVPVNMTEPPTEETLMQHTLWPEQQKLYGHGYEVHALAASHDCAVLASACRATSAEHAAVILWDTKSWQQIQKLISHQLTVTQIEFSPDSHRLVTVSRDRRWTLYQRRHGSNCYDMIASTDKNNGIHKRIIWCCAWTHDGRLFGTGSRDGKVCVWSESDITTTASLGRFFLYGKVLEASAPVTALAFAPISVNGCTVAAVGLETGHIRLFGYTGQWNFLTELDNCAAHQLTVRRVTFSPRGDRKRVTLASAGADHLVRIYDIHVDWDDC